VWMALIDEGTTAVEGEGATPIRVAVIVGRAIPLYASHRPGAVAEEARGLAIVLGAGCWGFRRSWKITASFTLDFSAAAIRASAFFVVMSMGFSVSTCRPCWAAAMPCCACRPGGRAEDYRVQRLVGKDGLELVVRGGLVLRG